MEAEKEGIFDYIKEHSGKVDSVDIVSHFKLSADITLGLVRELREAKRVRRIHVTEPSTPIQ